MTDETEPTEDGVWLVQQKTTSLVRGTEWETTMVDLGYRTVEDARSRCRFLESRWPEQFRLLNRVTGETLSARVVAAV